jgi:DNA-binding response OmpR family regulator
MPRLDGPDLCRKLRNDESGAYVYVVLLTVNSKRRHVIAGLDAGADDYLCKPFDPAEVE